MHSTSVVALAVMLVAGVHASTTDQSCDASQAACLSSNPLMTRKRMYSAVALGPEAEGPRLKSADVTKLSEYRLRVLARKPSFDIPTTSGLGGLGSDAWDSFLDSASVQGVEVELVGADESLGSEKVREWASSLDDKDIVLYFGENDDYLMLGESKELIRNFLLKDTNILFGASLLCKRRCAFTWPEAEAEGYGRYLVASSFIAKPDAFQALTQTMTDARKSKVALTDEDQLFALYFAERQELGLSLDGGFSIFQPLSALQDTLDADEIGITFVFNGQQDTRLRNVATGTFPAVLVANGNRKLLMQLGNYLPLRFHPEVGCITCQTKEPKAETLQLLNAQPAIAVHVLSASPFLELVLQGIADQVAQLKADGGVVPKVVVAIEQGPSATKYLEIVHAWVERLAEDGVAIELLDDFVVGSMPTFMALATHPSIASASRAFFVQSTVRLTASNALEHLLKQDKHVVGPMMTRDGKYFSTFWGASDGDVFAQCADIDSLCPAWSELGECETNSEWMSVHCPLSCGACTRRTSPYSQGYKRSVDYSVLATRKYQGVWAVPYLMDALLLSADTIKYLIASLPEVDEEMMFKFGMGSTIVDTLRQRNVYLWLDNQIEYGTLVDPTGYSHVEPHPDLFLLENNALHWEDTYLHPEYNGTKHLEFVQGRCWDIYNFPLFTEAFCQQLIDSAENFGQWSGGQKYDDRIKGGYEPVPTRDIHFNQFGFGQVWKMVLRRYVAPVVETQWVGYKLDGRETLDFIVKYQPEGQPFLRPHHDASTFSLNVALNRIGIDFEGGGTRFARQNCTVLSNSMGHALVHPGRLTHQHEGLYVTKGTRYIIVSFVDQV
eukprot:m.353590 g.353590  ORF g.353590 m.353590 type:complete len:838 (-) comp16804_c0_seq1:1424-3937(-)